MMYDLKRMVERGEISLRSAAYKLYDAGWFNFVPSDREVLNKLHIIVQVMTHLTLFEVVLVIASAISYVYGVYNIINKQEVEKMNFTEANEIWKALNDVMTRDARFNGYRPSMTRNNDSTYKVEIRECFSF